LDKISFDHAADFPDSSAIAEDDPLNLDDAASMEDIRNTMGDDILQV